MSTSKPSKESPKSPDDTTHGAEETNYGADDQDDWSEDDDEDEDESGHRKSRRLIIERKDDKQEINNQIMKNMSAKRPRLDSSSHHHAHNHQFGRANFNGKPVPGRGRHRHHTNSKLSHLPHEQRHQSFVNSNNLRQIPLVNNQTMLAQSSRKDPPKGPVIYVNPRFIKKFIEKSIKLSADFPSLAVATNHADNNSIPNDTSRHNTPSTSRVYESIDQIEFKTCSKKCIQAACTMAIIRLVTECIQDDKKQNESQNKILISRLIDNLCLY